MDGDTDDVLDAVEPRLRRDRGSTLADLAAATSVSESTPVPGGVYCAAGGRSGWLWADLAWQSIESLDSPEFRFPFTFAHTMVR
ncbi:hypothetical protein [Nocardia sp. NPDC004604]|uniref:hypothetical protein n=1 Tax=Nocardia sp. NPDC004604 TaxID=3157013 RepID=UPI0033B85758